MSLDLHVREIRRDKKNCTDCTALGMIAQKGKWFIRANNRWEETTVVAGFFFSQQALGICHKMSQQELEKKNAGTSVYQRIFVFKGHFLKLFVQKCLRSAKIEFLLQLFYDEMGKKIRLKWSCSETLGEQRVAGCFSRVASVQERKPPHTEREEGPGATGFWREDEVRKGGWKECVPLEHLNEWPECLAHGRQNTTQLPNVSQLAKTAAGIKTMEIHKHRSKQGPKIEVWRKWQRLKLKDIFYFVVKLSCREAVHCLNQENTRKRQTHISHSLWQKSSKPAGVALGATDGWEDTPRTMFQTTAGRFHFGKVLWLFSEYSLHQLLLDTSVYLCVLHSAKSAPCWFGALLLPWLVYAAFFYYCFFDCSHVFLGLHWLCLRLKQFWIF